MYGHTANKNLSLSFAIEILCERVKQFGSDNLKVVLKLTPPGAKNLFLHFLRNSQSLSHLALKLDCG